MFRKIATSLVATAALAASMLVTHAPSASASARDGLCDFGEFCLYYGPDRTGSLVDFVNTQRDYTESSGCIRFIRAGAGQNSCVQNNAASAWNRSGGPVSVFYNSDFGGVYDIIPNNTGPNLNDNVRKDNASHIIGDASLRFPLNVTQAQIKNRTPHWCWDSKTNCHHDYNAADIFAAPGTAVVSPVKGTVMSKRVSSSGSTATVKDAFGRLWFFQHMDDNPAPVVTVGQSISKGDRIGTVGTRAHASGTDPHLHIDMRVGVSSRVDCTGSGCAGYGFVNNQPLLRTAFLDRPAS
jgi:biotin carboxyl carrier protein